MKSTHGARSAALATTLALASILGFAGSAFAQSDWNSWGGGNNANQSFIAKTWAWNAQFTQNSDCYAYSGQSNGACIGYWSYNDYNFNGNSNNGNNNWGDSNWGTTNWGNSMWGNNWGGDPSYGWGNNWDSSSQYGYGG